LFFYSIHMSVKFQKYFKNQNYVERERERGGRGGKA